MTSCDCDERIGVEINSWKLFEELKLFFEEQVKNGVFADVKVEKPFFIGIDEEGAMEHFATKWYKCHACGCLWEFKYPDFPAKGFVKKYPDGNYTGTRIINCHKYGLF